MSTRRKVAACVAGGLLAFLFVNALGKLSHGPDEPAPGVFQTRLFKTSPDHSIHAIAANLEKKIGGRTSPYYEFWIVRASDGYVIESKSLPAEGLAVDFRGGDGGIFWQPDSRAVRFGTSDMTLWEYSLAENAGGEP